MNVLVLNVGSSSLKFQLVRTDQDRLTNNTDEKLARGTIERLGGEAVLTLRGGSGAVQKTTAALRDHRAAVEHIVAWLVSDESGVGLDARAHIDAVGHRVVHGGERFTRSVRIDDEVLRGIEDTFDLAPLHNPANLRGIAASRAVLGAGVPQVAVFDTAFHQTLPERVPMTSPSSGVNPIDVSTEWPPRMAHAEHPLPRCSVTRRVSSRATPVSWRQRCAT